MYASQKRKIKFHDLLLYHPSKHTILFQTNLRGIKINIKYNLYLHLSNETTKDICKIKTEIASSFEYGKKPQ